MQKEEHLKLAEIYREVAKIVNKKVSENQLYQHPFAHLKFYECEQYIEAVLALVNRHGEDHYNILSLLGKLKQNFNAEDAPIFQAVIIARSRVGYRGKNGKNIHVLINNTEHFRKKLIL